MARTSRSALAVACAAAALATANALSSLPAPGVPCVTVAPGNPSGPSGAAPTCDPTLNPFDYYGAMKAGTLNLAALGVETNGGCDFIEDTFEETFSSPVLNFTRWLPDELDGQEHCIGLPPSGPTTCTMMMTQQVKLAQQMPAALGGGVGAILTLSQNPCNDPTNPTACCNSKGTTCAKWAGAHLVSAGCIQYGILELEAAFAMPANAGGFYFTATYVVYGSLDPAWNEIDIGMINNVLGQLEFHATQFTADKDTPTATLMDALNFAQVPIGTSINVNTSIKAINNVVSVPRYYNSSFASQFHNYKIVWTRNTVAWLVDTVVYRNLTYAPWRPMSIRQILRTNMGVNAVGPQFGDSNVYIRRIRYTPLSDKAVSDAYRCTSMFACYGALPASPMGAATAYVSLASTPPAGTGRRHLLQTMADNGSQLEGAFATVVPGLPAANVTATPSAWALSFRLIIKNLAPAGTDALELYTSAGVQSPLISGMADDVIPSLSNIVVQSVTEDATGQILYVSFLVSGYPTAADMLSDYSMLANSGAVELDSTAAQANNALGLVTTPYVTVASATSSTDETYTPTTAAGTTPASQVLADPARCPSYPAAWDATCVDDSGALPTVWCADCVLLDLDSLSMLTTYSVAVPVAASAVAAVEASISSALSTGALASVLTRRRSSSRHLLEAGSLNLTDTNSMLLQRILTSQAAVNAAEVAAQAQALCGTTANKEMEWRATAIAFIVAFGCLIIALISFNMGKSSERKALAQMSLAEPKMMTTDTMAA